MKSIKLYDWNTVINFGKYNSLTIQQIYEQDNMDYLIWCLKNIDHVCFSNNVFNIIKDTQNICSNDLAGAIITNNKEQIKKLIEQESSLRKSIHLQKQKQLTEQTDKYSRINRNADVSYYSDYYNVCGNLDWLAEAAGTDDPEVMNDVYWNLD